MLGLMEGARDLTDGARDEFARDKLVSRDEGGIETASDTFLDRHLRDMEGILEPKREASPFNAEPSPRGLLLMGLGAKSVSSTSSLRSYSVDTRYCIASGSSKVQSRIDSRWLWKSTNESASPSSDVLRWYNELERQYLWMKMIGGMLHIFCSRRAFHNPQSSPVAPLSHRSTASCQHQTHPQSHELAAMRRWMRSNWEVLSARGSRTWATAGQMK